MKKYALIVVVVILLATLFIGCSLFKSEKKEADLTTTAVFKQAVTKAAAESLAVREGRQKAQAAALEKAKQDSILFAEVKKLEAVVAQLEKRLAAGQKSEVVISAVKPVPIVVEQKPVPLPPQPVAVAATLQPDITQPSSQPTPPVVEQPSESEFTGKKAFYSDGSYLYFHKVMIRPVDTKAGDQYLVLNWGHLPGMRSQEAGEYYKFPINKIGKKVNTRLDKFNSVYAPDPKGDNWCNIQLAIDYGMVNAIYENGSWFCQERK